MEIQERLKHLRKILGNLTQAEFSEALGFAPTSAASWEKRNPQAISPLAKNAMKRVFGINIEWLETGEGEPLLPGNPDPLDEIVRANGLTALDRGILNAYIQLPPEYREIFVTCMRRLVESGTAAAAAPIDRITAQLNAETADDPLEQSKRI